MSAAAAPWAAPAAATPWDDGPFATDAPDLVRGPAPCACGTACHELVAAQPVEPERVHPFPGNVLMHIRGMGKDSENMLDADQETRTVVESPEHAVVVTSLYHGPRTSPFEPTAMHRPVIDVDWPVKVVPSRTEGHNHLYIEKAITWEAYLGILDALVAAGIVEGGYVRAARTRGHTAVRVPWVHDDASAAPLPRQEQDARNRGVDFHARRIIRAVRSGDVAALPAAADELAATLGGVGEAAER